MNGLEIKFSVLQYVRYLAICYLRIKQILSVIILPSLETLCFLLSSSRSQLAKV